MRRVVTSALVVTVLSLIGFCGNSVALTRDRIELAYNSRNLIRLHILANSNQVKDQQIKIQIRDAVLAKARQLFLGVRDAGEALCLARANQEALVNVAADTIKKAGADYGARVEIGTYPFPARIYPFGILPAGEYQAVRVILGEGRGKNWWCVLFPPLCFLGPSEARVEGPVHVRLLFLERMLRRNGLSFDSFWRGWANFWALMPESSSSNG